MSDTAKLTEDAPPCSEKPAGVTETEAPTTLPPSKTPAEPDTDHDVPDTVDYNFTLLRSMVGTVDPELGLDEMLERLWASYKREIQDVVENLRHEITFQVHQEHKEGMRQEIVGELMDVLRRKGKGKGTKMSVTMDDMREEQLRLMGANEKLRMRLEEIVTLAKEEL